MLVVILAAMVLIGFEVRDRVTHVSETDARIEGRLVTISSRVSGWVTNVSVDESDAISVNQVLAIVDDRESRLRVNQLEAQVRTIGADRDRLGAERGLIDEQTRSRLETQRSRLNAASASVSALAAQTELAAAELARARSLYAKKVISRQELEKTQAESRRLEGEYRMAVAEREESRAKLVEERAERARLGVLDKQLEKLGYEQEELQARLEQQKLDLTDRTIRSPLTGVVDKTFVEVGEFVTPGQRLAVVHDPADIWVEANIKETQIRKLALGLSVEVFVDAFPDDTFSGEIISIGQSTTGSFALLPNPNPSGNFTKITQRLPVRIAIEQRDQKLRPGMMVEVRIGIRGR
ncbi:MAG: HlyD family secretion protein [Acidobacteriota bacterium]|nr:MAG: HlyD family secretion protein [Acidobacteriota bacterium]